MTLDPTDWDAYTKTAHELLDTCIERMKNADQYPWREVPKELKKGGYNLREDGIGYAQLSENLTRDILPYHSGNTHPNFFGWVQGTGNPAAFLGDMVASAMNSNCGGRDHGAVYVERSVIDWTKKVMGFPETASGVLVAGTSQATVISLQCACVKALGADIRETGNTNDNLRVYIASSVHAATIKAVELLGLGRRSLVHVNSNDGAMDPDDLKQRIDADIANGLTPLAIVATAGTVDIGAFDDFHAIANVAQAHKIWLHVDGAFGAWAKLADGDVSKLADGLERADSLACDFHKWMYVQYDCAIALIRDRKIHEASFSSRPNYLAPQSAGIGGGDPWYCDYGIDLSRGNRALKIWATISTLGNAALGDAIAGNCQLASFMASEISKHRLMEVVVNVTSNICVFTANKNLPASTQSELNTKIAQELQLSGVAVFSTTKIKDVVVLRGAITNHRTSESSIRNALDAIDKALKNRGY